MRLVLVYMEEQYIQTITLNKEEEEEYLKHSYFSTSDDKDDYEEWDEYDMAKCIAEKRGIYLGDFDPVFFFTSDIIPVYNEKQDKPVTEF